MKELVVENHILSLFLEGESVNSICQKLQVTKTKIYYVLRKNNLRARQSVTLSPERIKTLSREYKKGFTLEELAAKYSINKTKLYKLLNSYDLSDTKKEIIKLLHHKKYQPSVIADKLSITTESVNLVLKETGLESAAKTLKKAGLTKEEILEIRRKLNV